MIGERADCRYIEQDVRTSRIPQFKVTQRLRSVDLKPLSRNVNAPSIRIGTEDPLDFGVKTSRLNSQPDAKESK
jgi:hypothetical protein